MAASYAHAWTSDERPAPVGPRDDSCRRRVQKGEAGERGKRVGGDSRRVHRVALKPSRRGGILPVRGGGEFEQHGRVEHRGYLAVGVPAEAAKYVAVAAPVNPDALAANRTIGRGPSVWQGVEPAVHAACLVSKRS
jgi:hypothetical protein